VLRLLEWSDEDWMEWIETLGNGWIGFRKWKWIQWSWSGGVNSASGTVAMLYSMNRAITT